MPMFVVVTYGDGRILEGRYVDDFHVDIRRA